MIVKVLKLLGWAVGIALVALGIGRIAFPMATIPGGGTVNATVDSETRAAGALLIAFGAAYIWAIRRAAIPVALLRFLAMTMALLAATRVVSLIGAGVPHPIFLVAAVVEFVAAVLTYWYSTMSSHQVS